MGGIGCPLQLRAKRYWQYAHNYEESRCWALHLVMEHASDGMDQYAEGASLTLNGSKRYTPVDCRRNTL